MTPPLPGRRPGRGGGVERDQPPFKRGMARGRRCGPPKAAGPCGPQARKCVVGAEGAGGASRAVGPRGPKVFLFEDHGFWKPRDIWEPRDMYKSQQSHSNPRDFSARFLRYYGRLRDRSPFQGGPMGFGGLFPPPRFPPRRRG